MTAVALQLATCDLDDPSLDLAACRAVLHPDEHERAARFRFDVDRDRFVRGRAFLRESVGRAIGRPPESLDLVTNAQGKPALADAGDTGVWFNLAHSGAHAVIVLGPVEQLGVDVEVVRPGFADDEIAERFFAPSEVVELRALPADQQADAFFRCWTRKEAYIKARGGGLHIPLDSFTVAFTPGAAPALTRVEGAPAEPSYWTIVDTSRHTPGCVSAVAARAPTVVVAAHDGSS